MPKYLFNVNLETRKEYFQKIVADAKRYNAEVIDAPDAFASEEKAWFGTFNSTDEIAKREKKLQEICDDFHIHRLFLYTFDQYIPYYVAIGNYIFGYRIINQGQFKNRVQVLAILDHNERVRKASIEDLMKPVHYYVMTCHVCDIDQQDELNLFNLPLEKRVNIFNNLKKMIDTKEYDHIKMTSASFLLSDDRLPVITVNSTEWLVKHAVHAFDELSFQGIDDFAVFSQPTVCDYVLLTNGYIVMFDVKHQRLHLKGIVRQDGDLYDRLKDAYENKHRHMYPTAETLNEMLLFNLDMLNVMQKPAVIDK